MSTKEEKVIAKKMLARLKGEHVVIWEGIDASQDISLFEYGLLVTKLPPKDYPDEWFCIYQVPAELFVNKVHDLLGCYGTANVFGSVSHFLGKKEVKNLIKTYRP